MHVILSTLPSYKMAGTAGTLFFRVVYTMKLEFCLMLLHLLGSQYRNELLLLALTSS